MKEQKDTEIFFWSGPQKSCVRLYLLKSNFYYQLSPNILAEINALRENNITRFSRRLLIDNVLSRITSPKSYLLRAEATKK